MIFGKVTINPDTGTIKTHKESYPYSAKAVIASPRPFLVASRVLGGAYAAFAIAFFDLLYLPEIAALLGLIALTFFFGSKVSQLKIYGADLRGSTYGHLVWGSYGELSQKRDEITAIWEVLRKSDGEADQ